MGMTTTAAGEAAIWHELECGGYRTDLPLWLELAGRGARVLEVGAGSGRVALALARAGHRVTAVDVDGELLQELARRARAEGLDVATVQGDARALDLGRKDFDLCLAAMQTIQLFGGAAGRGRFLAAARRHLRPGGVLACAIVVDLEAFDRADGDPAPPPERMQRARRLYGSRATAVRVDADTIAIERERRVRAPGGPTVVRVHVDELARVSARELEREGEAAGLHALAARVVPESDAHAPSQVVLLRA